MKKPEFKGKPKPQFRRRPPTSSADDLKVPGYGEKPFMTDESGAKLRAQLIASGQIKENPSYDGYMTAEEVAAYKKKLIDTGLLNPGAGLARLRAAQERRARTQRFRRDRGGNA